MYVMAEVLPPDVLPPDKLPELDRMTQFIALFHGMYFLQATIATAAPRLDLCHWKDMLLYEVS